MESNISCKGFSYPHIGSGELFAETIVVKFSIGMH